MVVPLNQYNAEVKERETPWEWWRGIPHRWSGRDRNKETSCVSGSSSVPSEKTQESPTEILTGPTGPISEVTSEMLLSILIYFKQNTFLRVNCSRASLVAQWERIGLTMQETQVWSLIWEDPTHYGATKPMCPNFWACRNPGATPLKPLHPRAHALQQEKLLSWEPHIEQPDSSPCLRQLEKSPTAMQTQHSQKC